MSGTAPTFYRIPVTEELVDTISCAQHPPNQIVVNKLVPPMPHLHSYMSDGIIPLENRCIVIQCLEAFKRVRVLKWSFKYIIWNWCICSLWASQKEGCRNCWLWWRSVSVVVVRSIQILRTFTYSLGLTFPFISYSVWYMFTNGHQLLTTQKWASCPYMSTVPFLWGVVQ